MGAPGCDDAPLVTVKAGVDSKRVTFVYPYYENAKFLQRQIEGWTGYPRDLRDNLHIIIIDDGSPEMPAAKVLLQDAPGEPIDLKLFRIDVDVRWNWLAARNIGAMAAKDGWLLLSDMDHVVSEQTCRTLVYGQHDPNVIYRFSRIEHTGEIVHPHPNSWFMTREMYWKIGGYDEALSGHYGTDGDYRRRCVKTAPIRILTDALVRHEYVGDSSTTHYKRKQPEDAGKKKIIAARGPGWKPKVLSFPYREIAL